MKKILGIVLSFFLIVLPVIGGAETEDLSLKMPEEPIWTVAIVGTVLVAIGALVIAVSSSGSPQQSLGQLVVGGSALAALLAAEGVALNVIYLTSVESK